MKNSVDGEKRKHPRFPLGIMMAIHAKGQSVGKCRGTIADLSAGGMAFKTNALLDEGMSLHLKLDIPLEIRGEIRHIKGAMSGGMHRYGVRFHKIATPEEGRPDNFIAAKVQRPRARALAAA